MFYWAVPRSGPGHVLMEVWNKTEMKKECKSLTVWDGETGEHKGD